MFLRLVSIIILFTAVAVGTGSMANASSAQSAQAQQTPITSDNLWDLVVSDFKLNHHVDHAAVKREIKRYSSNIRAVEKMLERAEPYLYYIYLQTEKRDMPAEFVLLPVVESSYDPGAKSHAGAVGLWQIMPGTAKWKGVRMDNWFDGRRDVISSTDTALDYLTSLEKRYGNWELSAAAYNAGPGRVNGVIKKTEAAGKSTAYWKLPLPKETKDYVPRLYALAEIIKNADKYGLKLPHVALEPHFSIVTMKSQVQLKQLANNAGMSMEEFREYNPGYLRKSTRPNGEFQIVLPVANAKQLANNLNNVTRAKPTWVTHNVQHSDTLGGIAKQYGVSVASLQKVNDLSTDVIVVGEDLRVPMLAQAAIKPTLVSLDTPVLPTARTALAQVASAQNQPVSVNALTSAQLLSGQVMKLLAMQKNTVSKKREVPAMLIAEDDSQPISTADSLRAILSKIYND